MNKYIQPLILTVSIGLNFVLYKCNLGKNNELNLLNIKYFNNSQEFEVEKNKLGEKVYKQEIEIVEYSKKVNILLNENTTLRQKIDFQIKAIQKLEVKNKEIVAPAIEKKDTVYFYAGTRFELIDPCFSLKSKLTNSGLLIEEFSADTSAEVTISAEKKLTLRFSNPCINLSSLSSIHQKDKKMWLENKWFWFGIGILAGASTSAVGVYLLK